MDYTNFVKNYYRILMQKLKLNKFKRYFGTTLMTNKGFIPEKGNFIQAKPALSILPEYQLLLEAPLSEFEGFLDYYSMIYPELKTLFLGRDGLFAIYKMMLDANMQGKQPYDFIELLIDVNLDSLRESGILK